MRATVNKRNSERSNRSFMDYAIWVDFPLNAAICTCLVIKIIQAFRTGIDKALEAGFVLIDGGGPVDITIGGLVIVVGMYSAISVVIEFVYLILKMNKKEPFLTEKYAILSVVSKIIAMIVVAIIMLIFR